ncbi:MAG: formate/nitrite transporter family protein [Limnochordia bacterium]
MSDSLTPAEIAKAMCDVGFNKATRTSGHLVILGMLAGVYISFAGYLSAVVTSDLDKYIGLGLAKVISGSVFAIGLMLVVIAGAELFTGNSLMVIGLLDRRISATQMIRNWLIVYCANFVGSLLLVALIFASGLWRADGALVGARLVTIAASKVHMSYIEALTRGILGNWLVCLAVWMATASNDIPGKLLAVLFPVMMFVASGFEHSIANQFFIPLGILLSEQGAVQVALSSGIIVTNLHWSGFLTANLLPVTIGNIIGGGLFVGTLYWYVYLAPTKARISSRSKTPDRESHAHDDATA